MTLSLIQDRRGRGRADQSPLQPSSIESGDRALRKRAFEAFYTPTTSTRTPYPRCWPRSSSATYFTPRPAITIPPCSPPSMATISRPRSMTTWSGQSTQPRPDAPLCRLRKRVMGMEEVHPYDLYTPLFPEMTEEYEYDRAVELVPRALNLMGPDYVRPPCAGFGGGWVDVYENRGKRSGGYSWGSYGTHPYILLNYNRPCTRCLRWPTRWATPCTATSPGAPSRLSMATTRSLWPRWPPPPMRPC